MIYMDESGVESLTRNTCLENIVERYQESKKLLTKCQMCPSSATSRPDATIMCEQCEIYYCDACRDMCHPMRGPLSKHAAAAVRSERRRSSETREVAATRRAAAIRPIAR